jgi:hypothetical protein
VARLLAEFAGFAALLFLTRYVARGHLVPQGDQECHIGGIALDVLTHGLRFPLQVYAPNEYDNGSFFSGLLTAVSFSLLGRNILALKLVTHFISAAGAVATLWLLRGCLDELGLTNRTARWTATAALVIAIALAPRVVTICSMYGIGNHTEGSAIGMVLLALFSRRLRSRSVPGTAAFWALVGVALYLNKGTVLVIPVLAATQTMLAWRSPVLLAAACGGFVVGAFPELRVAVQQHGVNWGMMGWNTMAHKLERNSQGFPRSLINTLLFLGEYRIELLGAWTIALCTGVALFVRSRRRQASADGSATAPRQAVPITLGMVLGVSVFHLAELSVMARNGLDGYVIYGYPTLVVLFSVLVAFVCTQVAGRWGDAAGVWVGAAAIALTLVLYRPYAVTWGSGTVAALWRNQAGAACSWRFAEGFERVYAYGLAPPGQTRDQYAIAGCRSLSEPAQVLDCIGGVARELNWRENERIDGAPPAELSPSEGRAYAFHYGVHRKGDTAPCGDFHDRELGAICAGAVRLECLLYGDVYTRIVSDHGIGRPRCDVPEPPMEGFWSAIRLDLLARTGTERPNLERAWGDDNLDACKPVFDECF